MSHYLPLTEETVEQARFITDFKLGGRGLLEAQGFSIDGKMWGTFKNIKEKDSLDKWFIEDDLVREINDWYVQAKGME